MTVMERKAALPVRLQPDDLWERLLALAESDEPAMRTAFLGAVAAMRGRLAADTLEAAIRRGDVARIVELLKFDELTAALVAADAALDDLRARSFVLARDAAHPFLHPLQLAIHLGARAELSLTFRHVSPDVLAAIRRESAARIQGITQQAEAAVRALLERSFASGARSSSIVTELMDTVGLSVRQDSAAARYAAALAESDTSEARQAQLVTRYRKTLLTQRATLIARSETVQAMNEGQRASWATLVERGLLDDKQYEREWVAIAPSDGRTCPVCLALDGERAPIGGVYTDPAGEGGDGPINHPDCRCVEKLVPVKAK